MREIKLSFCITCLNRFSQIKKTLGTNLHDNADLKDDIEFILMDFNTPNLKNWVFENFKVELEYGYLKYFFSTELETWHCSVAKNTAHKYANGEILVNLDSDNYTGENGAKHILDIFHNSSKDVLLHQWSGHPTDGSYGRISYKKEHFCDVGGYNQKLLPVGMDDIDIIVRICFNNPDIEFAYYKSDPFVLPLLSRKNSVCSLTDKFKDWTIYTKTEKHDRADCTANSDTDFSLEEMNKINFKIASEAIGKGKYIANEGMKIGLNAKRYFIETH